MDVGVEIGDSQSLPLDEEGMCVVESIAGGGEDVLAASTTTYDNTVTGEGILVISFVTLISTVLSGFASLTTFVATIVSIEGGELLAELVTVKVSGVGRADGVAAEPPSTATTEYATRRRTWDCLVGSWGLTGRA